MLFAILFAPIAVFLRFATWNRWSQTARTAWLAVCTVLLLLFIARLYNLALFAIHHPPLWDAVCFWMYGRVALTAHAIYAPAAYHALALHLPETHDPEFSREVLDVGFPYPPFTIPLVAMLGVVDSASRALPLWYALDVVAIAVTALVVWRRFFNAYGLEGLLGCAVSIVAFSMVAAVIEIAQTILLLLMFVVLYEADSNAFRRGVWLGLACVIKPFAFLFLLYPFVRLRWLEILGAAASLGAASLAAVAIVGWNNVLAFFTSSPFHRATPEMFTEIANQSLYAAVLRVGFPYPVYVAISAALVLLAGALCRFSKESARDLCLALLLSLALLVYPAALWFYAVSLLFALWVLWRHRATFGAHANAIYISFVAVFYILGSARFYVIEMSIPLMMLCLTGWVLLRTGVAYGPVPMSSQIVGDVESV